MKRWITFLFIGIFLISSYLFFNREETYQTSSTNDIVVTGKSKKDGKYTIEADLPYANTSGTIVVREKSDWEKIEVGKTYFTVLTWYSKLELTQVFEEETFLEQWELRK